MPMPPPASGWQLRLLGSPRCLDPQGRAQRLSDKMLALLAYLALEGQAPRSQLAGLLWPDTLEAGARNNLVHLLRRMARQLGSELVQAGDLLRLAPGVQVDAHDGAQEGELLAGLSWPELPELEDWLLAWRERLAGRRAAAWRAEAQALEEAGRWSEALALVRRLRALDPSSEEALRREMRLHYLLGEAAEALAAYQRGAHWLREQLGAEPLPETRALAGDIRRGALPAAPRAPAPAAPPPARPALVGREGEWAQMEAAWAAGRGIVLSGEPGVGKTRLALEFLAAQGGGMRFRGCLGDAGLPYATHARTYRQVLEAYPDLPLPGWVRAELARILPQLGEAPGPIASEEQKTRFWQAKAEALRAATAHGLSRMVFDDTQFMDEASIEAGAFVFAQLGWGDPQAPYRTIHCFRSGELSPLMQGTLRAMVGAGLVTLIELGPLSAPAVEQLLDHLRLSPELARLAGGNPLRLLESARSLHGRGPAEGPLPPSLDGVIAARLSRLSPTALHAARVAAVLDSDFDLDLIAQTLGAPLLDTVAAWEELEAAQVVRGAAFEHDLIAEALRAGMPGAVRRLLHRAAARSLLAQGAHPARVASHWQAGGEPGEAAPWFGRAAEQALAAFRSAEAASYQLEAAAAYEASGQPEAALQARERAQALTPRAG